MKPNAKVIKAVKFEDGTYTINAAAAPFMPVNLAGGMPAGGHGMPEPLGPTPEELAGQEAARQVLAQAQEEAEFVLKLAREEAEALKQRAQQEAELLRAQAAQAAQQSGYTEGVAAGQQAGFEAVVNEYSHLLGALMAASEQAAAERQAWFAANEREMVKMAVLIAQKILLMELATSRQSVLKLAAAALKRINDKTNVRLRVHPDDLALVMKAKGPLMLSVDNLASLEVLGDPGVGLGGCIVETRTGIVDARVSTQLAEVATTLLELPLGSEELDPVVAQAIQALGQPGAAGSMSDFDASAWDDEPMPPVAMPAPRPAPAIVQTQIPAAPAPMPAPITPPPAAPVAPPVEEAVVPVAPEPVAPVVDRPEPVVEVAPVAVSEPMAPEPAQEPITQTISRMTDEEVEALTQALSELIPPDAPPAQPTGKAFDPSRRAADALALRLGKLKKGRAVAKLDEEYDMSLLEGALSDAELEAIVRHVMHRAPGETDIPADQPLVATPDNPMDAAAEALAERLGQKKKQKRNWYDGLEPLTKDGPSDKELDELNNALADDMIDQIMKNVVHPGGAPGDEPTEEKKPADLSSASDNLAKLLGKDKKKSNRPWYEGLE